jgi:hypothetical protein
MGTFFGGHFLPMCFEMTLRRKSSEGKPTLLMAAVDAVAFEANSIHESTFWSPVVVGMNGTSVESFSAVDDVVDFFLGARFGLTSVGRDEEDD